MKRIAVAALLAVLAHSAFAQQSETIDVAITNLDVVVVDAKGKHVSGLTRDDFELLIDGQPQALTNFSEFSRNATATTETAQPAPRRILFIVDNGTIELSARRKVFDATRATLDRLILGPEDRMAVATISRSITQRLQWTADKAEVLRTLNTLEKDAILPRQGLIAFERTIGNVLNDADSAATSSLQVLNPTTPSDDPRAGAGAGAGASKRIDPTIDFNQVIAAGREYAGSATSETKQTISALNGALAAFDGASAGRRLIILVGSALPLNAAQAIFQRVENVREQAENSGHRGFRGQRTASTLSQLSNYDVTPLVDALATSARLKGIAFYAVNPEFGDRQATNVTSRMRADHTAEFAAQQGQLDGYNRLATATGGAAMIGRPADQVLTEIVNDLDSYYSLGYRSNGPLTENSRIEVNVKNGLRARATIASGAVNQQLNVADQVLANHLIDPVNPLNISVVAAAPVMNGDKKTIALTVKIPVDSLTLTQEGDEYTAQFAVFVSLGDAEGNGSNPSRQEQAMRWPAANLAQVKGKTIGYALTIEAGSDRDRVSIGVLDERSGAAGFARVMLN